MNDFLRELEALCLQYDIAFRGKIEARITDHPVIYYTVYDDYVEIWGE